jgi:hypothetical protein
MTVDEIFEVFPKLKSDHKFKVTSKRDTKYNCIAWSVIYDDRNLWPPGGVITLDGVLYIWLDDLPKDDSLNTFTQLFQKFKYEVCEDHNFEEGYS